MAVGLYAAEAGPAGAPVVVLLHCMGRCGTMWEPHRARLSTQFRVLAPDLPGHGQSQGPFTVDGSVGALARLVAEVAPGRPVHLIGLSLGARVALKFASEHAVASLALLGCGIHTVGGGLDLAIARALPTGFYRAGAGKQAVIESKIELTTLDLAACAARVAARTLVVSGEKDRRYRADARELATTIPGAQLREIAGAGHLWPGKRVDEFVDLVTGWVRAPDDPGAAAPGTAC